MVKYYFRNFAKFSMELSEPDGTYKAFTYRKNGELFIPQPDNEDKFLLQMTIDEVILKQEIGLIKNITEI